MNLQQKNYLESVKYRVLAEPTSLIMSYFTMIVNRFKEVFPERFEENGLFHDLKPFRCDTVGCIAGHVCFMDPSFDLSCRNDILIEREATDRLGLTIPEAKALFYFPFDPPEALADVYASEAKALKHHKPGTLGYAKVVARAIDKCIARNYRGRRRAA